MLKLSGSLLEKYRERIIAIEPRFDSFPVYTTKKSGAIFILITKIIKAIEYYFKLIRTVKEEIKADYIKLRDAQLLPPLESLVYRENAMYLFVNVHGGIRYIDAIKPYVIPKGLEIFRVMQSTFGTVNLCTPVSVKTIYDPLLYLLAKPVKTRTTLKNNKKLIKSTLKQIIPHMNCAIRNFKSAPLTRIKEHIKDNQTYREHCLKTHTHHFTYGANMVDKTLSIDFSQDDTNQIKIVGHESINLVDYLRLPFINDHFRFKLSDIINLVAPYIKILVLIDLSCSNNSMHTFEQIARNTSNLELGLPSFKSPNFNSSPINVAADIVEELTQFKEILFEKFSPDRQGRLNPILDETIMQASTEYEHSNTESVETIIDKYKFRILRLTKTHH